jgi:hypothetical protein
VTAPFVLYGCAAVSVAPETEVPGGRIEARAGRAGMIVAAPHGTSDIGTGVIAAEVARRTGFGLVVATGFSFEADTGEPSRRRLQVNRPFEGTPGRPASEEAASARARQVYETYERRVRETAHGPLDFYAEIHGHNQPEAAGRIEVATVGIDPETARRLRVLLELVRDAHLAAAPGAPRLEVLMEGADAIRYTASGAKRDGILRWPRRAVHIELPRAARTEWRELYTVILAQFIVEAAAFPPAR